MLTDEDGYAAMIEAGDAPLWDESDPKTWVPYGWRIKDPSKWVDYAEQASQHGLDKIKSLHAQDDEEKDAK